MQASQVQIPECYNCKTNLTQQQQNQLTCKKCIEKQSQELSILILNSKSITQGLQEQLNNIKKYKEQIIRQTNISLNSAIYLDDEELSWSLRCQGIDIEESHQELQRQLKMLQQDQIMLTHQTQKMFKKMADQNHTIKQIRQKVDSDNLELYRLVKQHNFKADQLRKQNELYQQLSSDNLLAFIFNVSFEDQNGLINSEIISETNKNIWMIAQVANVIIKKALELNYCVLQVVDIQTNSETNSAISVQQAIRNHQYSKIKFQKVVSISKIKQDMPQTDFTSQQYQSFQDLQRNDDEGFQAITEIPLKDWEKWLPFVCEELDSIHYFLCQNYFKDKKFKPPFEITDNGKMIGGVVIGSQKSSKTAIKRILYFLKHIMNLFFYLSEY